MKNPFATSGNPATRISQLNLGISKDKAFATSQKIKQDAVTSNTNPNIASTTSFTKRNRAEILGTPTKKGKTTYTTDIPIPSLEEPPGTDNIPRHSPPIERKAEILENRSTKAQGLGHWTSKVDDKDNVPSYSMLARGLGSDAPLSKTRVLEFLRDEAGHSPVRGCAGAASLILHSVVRRRIAHRHVQLGCRDFEGTVDCACGSIDVEGGRHCKEQWLHRYGIFEI